MQLDWESEVRAVSAVALATSVAALAMQVFTLSGTHPNGEVSLRNMLKRVAPDGISDHVLEAAQGLLANALLEAEALKGRFVAKQ